MESQENCHNCGVELTTGTGMFCKSSNPDRVYCKACFNQYQVHGKNLGFCKGTCPDCIGKREEKGAMRVSTDRYIPGHFLGRPRTPIMLFDDPVPQGPRSPEQKGRPITPLELIK